MSERQRIVVIVGPTAGGKSALAVALAERFGGEVISADSMQVYRHLNAGTAKPTQAERDPASGGAVHHLIDCVEPTERFTVADWLERAERLIVDMHERGVLPIVVGGTNLYVKALLEGMFDGPPTDDAFRASLDSVDSRDLHGRLRPIDPDAFARIDPNDRKRIVRALEVHHATGKPITEQQTQWLEQSAIRNPQSAIAAYRHDPILLGLAWPVDAINRRINARVKAMFEPPEGEDLGAETRRLLDAGLLGEQAREAIGTKQVLEHLAGRCTRGEAIERVKIDTRRFAKGQRTWLKRYRNVRWLDAANLDANALNEAACRVVEEEFTTGDHGEPRGKSV